MAGRLIAAATVAVAVVGSAVSARADLRWMEPESPAVTPGATIWVGVTKAAEFGAPAESVAVPGAGAVTANLSGQSLTVFPAVAANGLTRFNVTLPRPGVATLVADLPAERRTFPHGEVERYLRAMYATDDVRARWAEFPADAAWRELYRERLKTFVRIGQPTAEDRTWANALSSGLDLVPLADPTTARENEEFAIRITSDGQPLSGCIVSFLSHGESREHVVVTDADGRAAAPLDARGAWFVRGIQLRAVTASDHDWATDVVGVTIYVP